ncbi:hypothetical protein H0H92_001297, partial [Tricholoma furcatifolium]
MSASNMNGHISPPSPPPLVPTEVGLNMMRHSFHHLDTLTESQAQMSLSVWACYCDALLNGGARYEHHDVCATLAFLLCLRWRRERWAHVFAD